MLKNTNFLWALLDALAMQGIQFVTMLWLARHLLPSDFGVVAIALFFIGIGNVIIDGGFAAALIRTNGSNEQAESSVFAFNLIASTFLYLLIIFSSHSIALYFSQPLLSDILRILGLSMWFESLGVVHFSKFKKSLDFKNLSIISLTASVASSIVSVFLFYIGFGLWSIVLFTVSNKFLRTILYFSLNKWRPQTNFMRFRYLTPMMRFSLPLFFVAFLDAIFNNLYNVLIGKVYSTTSTGLYSRARSIQQIPTSFVVGALNRVTYSSFSKIRYDEKVLKKYYLSVSKLLIICLVPLMQGIYYFADRIILILFGEAWYDAIPFLKVLVFIGLFEALYRYEVSLLKSLGYTKLILRLEIVKKVLLLLGVVITYDMGIIEMLYASAIVTLLIYLFSLHGAMKNLRLSFFSYLESFFYVFLAQVVLVVLLVVASKFGFDWVALLVFLVFMIISYIYLVRSLLSGLRNLSVESK